MPGTTQGITPTPLFRIIEKSIYVPDADLYLDARRKKALGFISHAHSDHSAHHEKILCTPATAEFLNIRFKNNNCLVTEFGKTISLNNAMVTLHPAGHILGSAQIQITTDHGRLLYTGDFRTRESRTAEPFKQFECDVLIMETTFGKPHYVFPPRQEIENQLLRIIREKLSLGITPVIFAYPLGKSHEILSLLSRENIPLAVEYQIIRLAKVYQKYGVDFGAYEKFRPSEFRNKVLLLPFGFRFQRFIKNLSQKYTIFLSGWGMDPSAKFRFGVDQILPYSDHADFEELIEFAGNTKAKEIYCTHGQDDFVTILNQKGFNAKPLFPPAQISLFY